MPDTPESKVRARVGAIGFSGKAGDTLVKSLSGGEKARLLLGLATFAAPNMIILDEPTNHLDIDSRAALAEAINEFPGAVIMVSHDRYLIEACADQLWVVADQKVTTYDGDLDDYRRMVLSARGMRTNSRDRGNERDNVKETAKPERGKSEKRAPLKQKIAGAEAEIERINGIIAKIDAALALPDLFKRDPKQAAQLSKARAGAASALQRAEENWLGGEFGIRSGRRDSSSSLFGDDDGYVGAGAGFFFAFGLAILRLRRGFSAAFDRRQASRR